MAAASLAGSTIGGEVAAKEAAGLIKTVVDALNHNLVTFRFGRDPKNHKKMRLESVDVNVTVGLVLGAAALALLWEIGNWFAKSGIGGGDGSAVPDVLSLLTANPTLFLVANAGSIASGAENAFASANKTVLGWFGVKQATHDQAANPPAGTSVVAAPSTFGAAYNAMMRDFVVGGPGTAAAVMRNLAAKYMT
jgi:hypothetical protein